MKKWIDVVKYEPLGLNNNLLHNICHNIKRDIQMSLHKSPVSSVLPDVSQESQSSIQDQLKKIYSEAGLAKHLERQALLAKVIELTPSKKLTEVTTHPLLKRPPVGFHQLHIEYAMRSVGVHEMQHHAENLRRFKQHLTGHPRTIGLKEAAQLSKEAYLLAKQNGDPKQGVKPHLKTRLDTLFDEKFHDWKLFKAYGDEKPSDPSMERMPRAFVAVNPDNKQKRKKAVIVLVGAEVMPTPLESWWTNQREGQDDIWGKVNFFRDAKEHTGIKAYALRFVKNVETMLCQNFSLNELSEMDFELMGHSTGGVLAILLAKHLKQRFSKCTLHVIGFGTPNFMNAAECRQLAEEFRNDAAHSVFNLMAHDDPSAKIYGEDLHQPQHTILLPSREFNGKSFDGVCAASAGTTRLTLKNHYMRNYQGLVEDILNDKINKTNLKAKL